ncbi:MAG: PorT family protein [Bacteroides sp.]|nr:PorT family protein [Bacteroides sp.]
MKRIMIALMALVMTIGVAGAQVRFGIKAGANFNSIHFKDLESSLQPDNSCGFNVGVMTEFTVPIVGLCFDASLLYSRMNNAISKDYSEPVADALDSDMSWGKNFLEIPINIKYKFQIPMVANIVKPYIFTGPTFAFKLDKSIMDRTYQAAWNVGIGVELINHLQVSGSYGFGINNVAKEVFKDGLLGEASKLKANNNYWTVSAAWLF